MRAIAAAQRVEHYEIAAYGTVIAWAKAMGHEEVANILHEREAGAVPGLLQHDNHQEQEARHGSHDERQYG